MEEAELFTSTSPLKAQEVQCCAAAWQCRCLGRAVGVQHEEGSCPLPWSRLAASAAPASEHRSSEPRAALP